MKLIERFKIWQEEIPAMALLRWVALFVITAFALYLPIGMFMTHVVDDDADFIAPENYRSETGSYAVAIAAALVDREIHQYHWTPNDPWFMPGAWLDRMPAFQRGIVAGLSRFAIELSDQIGRTRGTSRVDPDLEQAAGLLKYSPYIWMFDKSPIPTKSSTAQYKEAMGALLRYNARLARKDATFDRRADNLMETLQRMATDLGASSAMLEDEINSKRNSLIDTNADEVFYFTKGRMYAFYLLMREMEKDFPDIIRDKGLNSAWKQAVESLREGSELRVFFVFNAAPDNQILPNHLAAQGFYLLRARTQLHEVVNILLK